MQHYIVRLKAVKGLSAKDSEVIQSVKALYNESVGAVTKKIVNSDKQQAPTIVCLINTADHEQEVVDKITHGLAHLFIEGKIDYEVTPIPEFE